MLCPLRKGGGGRRGGRGGGGGGGGVEEEGEEEEGGMQISSQAETNSVLRSGNEEKYGWPTRVPVT